MLPLLYLEGEEDIVYVGDLPHHIINVWCGLVINCICTVCYPVEEKEIDYLRCLGNVLLEKKYTLENLSRGKENNVLHIPKSWHLLLGFRFEKTVKNVKLFANNAKLASWDNVKDIWFKEVFPLQAMMYSDLTLVYDDLTKDDLIHIKWIALGNCNEEKRQKIMRIGGEDEYIIDLGHNTDNYIFVGCGSANPVSKIYLDKLTSKKVKNY